MADGGLLQPDSATRDCQLALPRSAVRLLAACAQGDHLCPELGLGDTHASSLFAELGGSLESFGKSELRCAAFRASLVDQMARGFFARQPSGVGVSLWPMLGTRAHRLHDHAWMDLDAPAVAALRERYLPARAGWQQLSSCLCGVGRASSGDRAPRLYVMDESVLPLHAEAMMRVLDSLVAHAPSRSELIFAYDEHAPLRRAERSATLELVVSGPDAALVRYPRLRFVDARSYPEELYSSWSGVNAVARLQSHDAPAFAHLQVL